MFLNEINCREQKGERRLNLSIKNCMRGEEEEEEEGRVGEGLSWNTMARAADNPMIIFQARVRNLNKTWPLLQASWLNPMQ